MRSRLLAVTFDARDPSRLARFWAQLLRRTIVEDGAGLLLPGDDTQVGLRFAPEQAVIEPRLLHLHLTSTSADDQAQTVATVRGLGGDHLDVGQPRDVGYVVMADPEGNAFCVTAPGNNFLAGCGFLGEVACDGSREVGLFWAAVLGWPLVWDQDGETAIQSPYGGTKLAWGGPPLEVKVGPNRQRFDLAPTGGDQRAEIDRLVSLGATRLATAAGGVVLLADPDGNEFTLRRS